MDVTEKQTFWSTILTSIPARIVSFSGSGFALFLCVLAATFIYRIQLTVGLVTSSVKPFDFNPPHPVLFILDELPIDLVVSLGSSVIIWALSRLGLPGRREKKGPLARAAGLLLLQSVLIVVLVIHRAHLRLLFDGQTGLDLSVLREVFSGASLGRVSSSVEPSDLLFLLVPIIFFWLIPRFPGPLKIWLVRSSFFFSLILLLVPAFTAHPESNPAPAEIRLNPVLFLISDVSDRLRRTSSDSEAGAHVGGVIESGLRPAGPLYIRPVQQVRPPPLKGDRPWNIVFFIMESVGTRYMFDTSRGNPMPMPFLQKLSRESWYLRNHYTTSNVSSKAIFSLLSGLYDFFNPKTFGTRPDAAVPSLYNFIAKDYDSFFVTPGSLSWYFPGTFFKNSGFPEIHSYENLNFKIKEEFHSFGHYIARDEQQTADFFSRRLEQAREPFLGVYISFTAHFPYFDNGPQYHVLDEKFGLISRYYSNLNLLDHLLERTYEDVKKKGCLGRTLFVIVGDHGQAFGQHQPNNYMHFRYSYNENLETPALLYQPALFPPKTFDRPTHHVDLLPTLLDAMQIPYDPMLLDGESLFVNRSKRKYLFFYGLEESISSLDDSGIKVQESLNRNKCWAYDLKQDPGEERRLDGSSFPSQLEALRRFTTDHDHNLLSYNASLHQKTDYKGRHHPLLHR